MGFEVVESDVISWAKGYDGPPFHAMLCDPPYELGFMGKKWDAQGASFQPETWTALSEHLLPGAMVLAFGGTRTFHRLVCAIEDAGLEIRDTVSYLHSEGDAAHPLLWVQGQGFPKSHDPWKSDIKPLVEERLREQGVCGEIEWK